MIIKSWLQVRCQFNTQDIHSEQQLQCNQDPLYHHYTLYKGVASSPLLYVQSYSTVVFQTGLIKNLMSQLHRLPHTECDQSTKSLSLLRVFNILNVPVQNPDVLSDGFNHGSEDTVSGSSAHLVTTNSQFDTHDAQGYCQCCHPLRRCPIHSVLHLSAPLISGSKDLNKKLLEHRQIWHLSKQNNSESDTAQDKKPREPRTA